MPRLRSVALGRPLRRRGVRIKLDENLGHTAETRLRAAGHDVDTVHDEDLAGAGDDRVFNAARAEGRILVTLDVDFANPNQTVNPSGSGRPFYLSWQCAFTNDKYLVLQSASFAGTPIRACQGSGPPAR